jgi:Fe-S cluster assembly protein SufD
MSDPFLQHLSELFEQQCQQLPSFPVNPAHTMRQAAFESAMRLGMPNRRHELWKHTPLLQLFRPRYQLLETPHTALPQKALNLGLTFTIVFHNGRFMPHLTGPPPAGVTLYWLNDLSVLPIAKVERFYHTQARHLSFFKALNHAFGQDGLIIEIEGHIAPWLSIVHQFETSSNALPKLSQSAIQVVLAPNAKATLVEQLDAPDTGNMWLNSQSKISLGAQAQCTYYRVENLKQFCLTHELDGHLGHQAQFNYFLFSSGGALARHDLVQHLTQPEAKVQLQALLMPQAKRHVEWHSEVIHQAMHTTSCQQLKAVVAEYATASIRGKIQVNHGADASQAAFNNHNILLAPSAKVSTLPQLEIYADDVQCTHGATVGQLQEAALFYLQSRGLSLKAAQKLLLLAFIHDLLADIPLALRHHYIDHQLSD